jgi:hypothetical protein
LSPESLFPLPGADLVFVSQVIEYPGLALAHIPSSFYCIKGECKV